MARRLFARNNPHKNPCDSLATIMNVIKKQQLQVNEFGNVTHVQTKHYHFDKYLFEHIKTFLFKKLPKLENNPDKILADKTIDKINKKRVVVRLLKQHRQLLRENPNDVNAQRAIAELHKYMRQPLYRHLSVNERFIR